MLASTIVADSSTITVGSGAASSRLRKRSSSRMRAVMSRAVAEMYVVSPTRIGASEISAGNSVPSARTAESRSSPIGRGFGSSL